MSLESVVRNIELAQRLGEGNGLISPLKAIQYFQKFGYTCPYIPDCYRYLFTQTVYPVYLFPCRWQQCIVSLISWL